MPYERRSQGVPERNISLYICVNAIFIYYLHNSYRYVIFQVFVKSIQFFERENDS